MKLISGTEHKKIKHVCRTINKIVQQSIPKVAHALKPPHD
jgi:hypothetical protein